MVAGDTSMLTQMRRGAIEFCVLALLEKQDRYGFEITRLAQSNGLVTSEGTIYPILTRLRNEGFVKTYWKESSAGPPRRYYKISTFGREALQSSKDQWTQFRNSVDKILREGEST